MVSRRTIRFVLIAAIGLVAGCDSPAAGEPSGREREEIAASIRALVTETYDLSKPNAVQRLMSLYPDSGPVYSTSSGHISTTRAELQGQIETFWKYVGSNMRNPRWEWTAMHIDVLSRYAAALTASYRIPHMTPQNTPHVIAGAWTAVMVKRGGKWVVIQEHLSDVPSAAGSAQAEDHSGH